MAVDYYKLLQVQRNDKGDDLRKAAEAKLNLINDAYKVLSDPRKRAVYDQYGEEGLKGGVPPPNSSSSGGQGQDGGPTTFRFNTRSPDDIFSEIFGFSGFGGMPDMSGSRAGGNPFQRSIFGEDIFAQFRGGAEPSAAVPRKAAPIERTLRCTLEDLYKGTPKKMKISRDVPNASRRTTTVEETLTIEIKPGWKKGTKITFPEKGHDTRRGVIPADIVFIVDEKPHGVYKRDGDDLIVTQTISLAEALTGHTAQLTALDGRNLSVSIDSIISQTHEEVVRGEGMPNQKEPSKKGNLIVKFSVKFPNLTPEQKTGIRMLLTSL